MGKKKALPVCVSCNSNEALYIILGNGERLPNYVMRIGAGIWCNICNEKDKVGA